ncbi:MAG: saccharopine dehydrogenase NADP-binding domain-containing protein, partial [Verrucomicrobiota bacterium]
VAQAEERIEKHPRGRAVELDARDTRARDALVKRADLVISMLPAQMHPPVAKACIQYKKHFVTASYVSPELRDLAEAAERAGVTLLNEMGVEAPLLQSLNTPGGLEFNVELMRSYKGRLSKPL